MPSDDSPPADSAREAPDQPGQDRIWHIPDISPAAVEAARGAARRLGVPLAVWLAGLIHSVADEQDAQGEPFERK